MTELLIILAFAAGTYLWLSTMRARDVARSVVAALCQQHGLQLLDQSVALRKIRFSRHRNGNLILRRLFRFDYSDNGFHRRDGLIWMHGHQAQWISLEVQDGTIIEEPGKSLSDSRAP